MYLVSVSRFYKKHGIMIMLLINVPDKCQPHEQQCRYDDLAGSLDEMLALEQEVLPDDDQEPPSLHCDGSRGRI